MKPKRLLIFFVILTLLVPNSVFAKPAESGSVPGGPTFWVEDVQRDESVRIRVRDLPDGDHRFRVEIGRIGNNFDPVFVGFLDGPNAREFTATFKIPSRYRGENFLAIQVRDNVTQAVGYDIFANYDGFDTNDPLSLSPVHHSSAQSNGTSVGIFDGPNFWVEEVNTRVKPYTFELNVRNYYGEDKYRVLVGFNDQTFDGFLVGTIDGSYGVNFKVTFELPSKYWDQPDGTQIMVRLVNNIEGHSGSTAFAMLADNDWKVVSPFGLYTTTYVDAALAAKARTGAPNMVVLNVVEDTEVTIQVGNFPPDMNFTVTMGDIGTQGIAGFVIGTQPSGGGGSFIVTYPIPAQLKGKDLIAVRFQSQSSGHFTYDYFENIDGYNGITGGASGSFNADYVLDAGTYPYFVVNSVVKDNTVTVSGFNFTKNDTYHVRMAPFGTEGIGGEIVSEYTTDDNGTFTTTFDIPPSVQGLWMIALRFESTNTDYFAFNFFYNQ
jgi:hypothetical protein